MNKVDRSHHYFYLFAMKNGRKKLGYGTSPEDALSVLSYWHTDDEMAEIINDDYIRLNQREMNKYTHQL